MIGGNFCENYTKGEVKDIMRRIELFDTTLRDGSQAQGVSLSVKDKLNIAKRLDDIGVTYIEGGWPGSNPKDIEFFKQANSLGLKSAIITAFGSTRRADKTVEKDKSIQAILESEVKAAAIFGKSWDFHVTHALKTTLDENLAMIYDSVKYLTEKGIQVIFDGEHFFDGYKANPDYAMATIKAAEDAGAQTIALCDTNGGMLPSEVQSIIEAVIKGIKTPLGIHAHNDSGLGVANTLVAVNLGVNHIHGTINGLGERCGNADLCAIIPNIQLKMGIDCLGEQQLEGLTELSRYVYEICNLNPDNRQPYVGNSVFAHKGGIHVSAMRRHPETYEHINPQKVGNQRRVLVSELSGMSNVLYKAEEFGITLEKGASETKALLEKVKEMEHAGYQFEGAEASFELLMKKVLGMYKPNFELVGFRMIIDKRNEAKEPVAEATIKIKVQNEIIHTVAEGDGPVNALDKALRKALEGVYPHLKTIKLTDYKVRVLDEKSATAAKVRVLIETTNDKRSWGTVGVSRNIIEASWRALVDSLEYGLLQEDDE